MKKVILSLILTIAVCGAAQAQYGSYASEYTLKEEFQVTTAIPQYLSLKVAQAHWTAASAGRILRLGFGSGFADEPITDVRLVAIDGSLICVSDIEFGCNGF